MSCSCTIKLAVEKYGFKEIDFTSHAANCISKYSGMNQKEYWRIKKRESRARLEAGLEEA